MKTTCTLYSISSFVLLLLSFVNGRLHVPRNTISPSSFNSTSTTVTTTAPSTTAAAADFNGPDLCLLPAETGMCRAAFPKFYYNHLTNSCEQFTYGGCDGNDNKFDSLEECNTTCNNSTVPVFEGADDDADDNDDNGYYYVLWKDYAADKKALGILIMILLCINTALIGFVFLNRHLKQSHEDKDDSQEKAERKTSSVDDHVI